MVELKILKLEHNKVLPEYKTEGASGMDLSAAITEAITLAPLERRLVPTGIKIELPLGYEAQIRARSGLSIKHGITLINAVGTVDSDYRGEVCVPLVNLSNETYTILPDERIAQMVICKVEQAKIVVQDELADSERGEGGFGYDPIFFVPEFGCSTAELTMEQKNEISHRGKALRAIKDELR